MKGSNSKENIDNSYDFINQFRGTESANHIIMRLSLVFYFLLLGETFLQYIFLESSVWEYILFWVITILILCQITLFMVWRRSRLYGRATVILFTIIFTYMNLITRGNNMVLLLPIPLVALSMLYMSKRMVWEEYVMWGINCVLRLVQISQVEDNIELYKGFAWVLMICAVYAVVVYAVNESLSSHYKEVCHNLHHENTLHDKLYQQSTVDSTTGLFNRNSYNTYIAEYEPDKYDNICCIYIDVNGLHEYNNTYGHQAGDKMLKTVAVELKKCFKEHRQYRIGGDEFVIISENTAFKVILAQLKQFREQMKQHNIYIASGMEWREEDMNLSDIIKRADAKMYQDKERFYKTFPNDRENGSLYQKVVE